MHIRVKCFFTLFFYIIKKRIIASNARTTIHARDRVERIKSQKNNTGRICSFHFFFLKYPRTKTGKNAINQKPKLVGLSNKNWFLTFHLFIKV